jgi:hypothetical protein
MSNNDCNPWSCQPHHLCFLAYLLYSSLRDGRRRGRAWGTATTAASLGLPPCSFFIFCTHLLYSNFLIAHQLESGAVVRGRETRPESADISLLFIVLWGILSSERGAEGYTCQSLVEEEES